MLYTLTEAAPQTELLQHDGGPIQVQVAGTFGSATVQLLVSQDQLPLMALSDFAITEASILQVNLLKSPVSYAFAVTGATGTTDLQVSVL